ncbi:MAG: trimethylamine methyltransferase family protein [Promethearchaeota archaeon]
MRARLTILNDDELYQIHLATLEILERVGMFVGSNLAIKIFKDAGAIVDEKDHIVKIPSYLVKEALQKAPERIVLCGREPKHDIKLENGRVFFGMGSTTVKFMDIAGDRKPAMKDYIGKAARLADGLPNMKFVEQFCCALDYQGRAQDLHEISETLLNSEKPMVGITYSPESTRDAIKIASLIMGGEEELRRKPLLTLYSEPTAPLKHDKIYIENVVECAKAGLPVIYGSLMVAGSTGPITLAGTLAASNAEILAGLVISELVRKGTPYIWGNISMIFDPRTAIASYGSPEFAIINAAGAQLARFYKLPFFGTGGVTDSKVVDGQAISEATMSGLMATLSGTNLVHDCGYIESAMTGSLEMLVINDEIAAMCDRIARGMEVNDETLATDVVRDVGPGGHFLSHKHTLKFVNTEFWLPTLMDRNTVAAWTKKGSKDLLTRAREKATNILREHKPEPVDSDIVKDIKAIIDKAERREASEAKKS